MDLSPTIKAVQRAVGVTADGSAGPLTWAAISKAVKAETPAPQSAGETPALHETPPAENLADPQSEKYIATLNAVVRPLARQLILLLNAKGMPFKITSGTRTEQEQNDLYEIGRTRPNDEGKWKTVTNARAWQSNHNFGFAFDITLYNGRQPVWESPLYRQAAVVGKDLGLLWGGDWSSDDEPHFEYRPAWAKDLTENEAIAEYRGLLENGKALV